MPLPSWRKSKLSSGVIEAPALADPSIRAYTQALPKEPLIVATAQLKPLLIREGLPEQKPWPERRRMPMAKPRGLRTRSRAEAIR